MNGRMQKTWSENSMIINGFRPLGDKSLSCTLSKPPRPGEVVAEHEGNLQCTVEEREAEDQLNP